jgi:hypothetical protein
MNKFCVTFIFIIRFKRFGVVKWFHQKKGIEEGLFPEEQSDFEQKPKEKPKKKTKKHKIKVNPPGKKGTRKIFEIVEEFV